MAAHLTKGNCRASRSAVYPMTWMSLMMICCRMTVKRMRMLGVSVRKKALTVNMETVALIGKGT